MSFFKFAKNRGKLFVVIHRMGVKHVRGYTHIIKLGLAEKRLVFCLRPEDMLELRDRLLEEYPLNDYPKGKFDE